jgi:hypothetical protein
MVLDLVGISWRNIVLWLSKPHYGRGRNAEGFAILGALLVSDQYSAFWKAVKQTGS